MHTRGALSRTSIRLFRAGHRRLFVKRFCKFELKRKRIWWICFKIGFFGQKLKITLFFQWQIYLYRRNQRATKSQIGLDSLTARFQQVENVHTTRLVYPIMLVYMFMCLLGLTMSQTRYELMRDGKLAQAKIVMQVGNFEELKG